MTLSIVIVNYKSESLILDCLRSISTYTKNISYEVIVIDNSFVKGKNTDVLNEFPATIWEDLGYNAGFSKANNKGINLNTFLSPSVIKFVLEKKKKQKKPAK